MRIQGKLTKEKMAHTMPVDAPVYHKKPFYFRGARMYSFRFETDPAAAAELIPAELTLAEPASATLMFCEYPWSTIGTYKEAILSVNVCYKGETFQYLTHLILDSCEPILVGREIYGIPKKMGAVEFTEQGDVLAGFVERPKGIRIASSVFRAEAPLTSPPDGTLLRTLTLRTIPSPEKDTDHSLVELIETNSILSSVEMWSGTGSCHFPEISVFDPWHKLPVKKMLETTYMVTDIVLTGSRVVARL
jgi:acetoacetate decarboxylase